MWGRLCSLALGDSGDGENRGGKGGLVQSMQPRKGGPLLLPAPRSGRRVSSKFPTGFWTDVNCIPAPSALPLVKA